MALVSNYKTRIEFKNPKPPYELKEVEYGFNPKTNPLGYDLRCPFCKGIYAQDLDILAWTTPAQWRPACPSCGAVVLVGVKAANPFGGTKLCVDCNNSFDPSTKAAPHNKDDTRCRNCEKKRAYARTYAAPTPKTCESCGGTITQGASFRTPTGYKCQDCFFNYLQKLIDKVSNGNSNSAAPISVAVAYPTEFWFSYNGTWFQAWRFIPKSFNVVCPICDALLDVQKTGTCSCGAKWLTPSEVDKGFEDMARYGRYRNCTTGKGKATATWDSIAKAYKFNFDYDADFVAIIKQFIPAHERSYDPPSRTWIFTEEAWEALKDVAALKFDLTVMSKETVEEKWKQFRSDTLGTKVIDTDSEFVKFQKMLSAAGVDFDATKRDDTRYVLKQYRRALLQYYHPDKFPERAKECSVFNETFQNLQKFFGMEREQEQLT